MSYYIVLYVCLAFVFVVLGMESRPCFVLGKCSALHCTPVSQSVLLSLCPTEAGKHLCQFPSVDYLTKILKPVIKNSHLGLILWFC